MKNFEIVVSFALAISGIFAATVVETNVLKDLQEDLEISDKPFETRINWGPVWDDIDGSNEFVLRVNKGKDNCFADESKGLVHLFKESKKLLPIKEIQQIVESYANDPEFKALKAFIQSSEYKEKAIAIRNSKEYQILKSYACSILHINLEDSHFVSRHVMRAAQDSGIKGLIHKIHSVIPHQKLKDLYNNLMHTDTDLMEAMAHIKSDEFKQIIMNLRNNVPAYKELKDKLIAIGVPVEELRGVISSVLGWNVELEQLA